MQVGACGVCCDACGLKGKKICPGCWPGNDSNASKKVKFLKSINVVCPVLDCAVKKKIAFCSKDCDDFPCQIFDGEFPYSKGFLDMYRSRVQKKDE